MKRHLTFEGRRFKIQKRASEGGRQERAWESTDEKEEGKGEEEGGH